MSINRLPKGDGDVNDYQNHEARSTRYWNFSRNVIFINGMDNSPKNHMDSAVGLSKLQMCKVTGVYNKAEGKFKDLVQCLQDKLQWDGMGLDRKFSNMRTFLLKAFGNPKRAEDKVLEQLDRNPAAVPLFELIKSRAGAIEIFAHSQGNLILSNVLTALAILGGNDSLSRITVNSFGSPTVHWPVGFTHRDHGFTFDPVNWLSGFDASFKISKVGRPKMPEGLGVFSHGFRSYLADDAAFVINHFRWGSFGMTARMDEEGLAEALADMGRNIPRIRKIFKRLVDVHSSDSDDIAELYINKVKNLPPIMNAIKEDTVFKNMLIKALDDGPTFAGEQEVIDLLKS